MDKSLVPIYIDRESFKIATHKDIRAFTPEFQMVHLNDTHEEWKCYYEDGDIIAENSRKEVMYDIV